MNNRFYLKTAISRLLILVIVFSMVFGAVPSTVGAAEIKSDGYTWGITEETLSAFLSKNISSVYMSTGYSGHLQGFTIDDEMKYIYASYTKDLVKIEVETGNVVGTVKGFPGHLGDLAYYDGRVYGSLTYGGKNRHYVAVFECDKIEGTLTYNLKDETFKACMSTLYLSEVVKDYNQTLVNNSVTYDPSIANYGNDGIDGITFGKAPDTGEDVLMVAYAINGDTDAVDYDRDYQVLVQYNLDTFLESDGNGGTQIKTEYRHLFGTADNGGPTHSNKYFVYTGNTNYGVQSLEYDSRSNDYIMAVYPGKTSAFTNFIMYHVDNDIKPVYKTLEHLGKNADAYKEAGLDKGNVLTLAEIGELGKDGVVWGSKQNPEGGVDTGIEHLYGDYFLVSNSKEEVAGSDVWTATAMLYQYDRENDVFNKIVSADGETSTYSNYDIIKELAYAYDRQGAQILYDQYNARRSIYSSPEDATAQRTIFFDCSSYVNSCYREAFGVNVLPYEIGETGTSPSTSNFDTYAKNNPNAVDVVGYWETTDYTTDAARQEVVDYIYANIQPGDVLTYRNGKTSGTSGHVYMYMGDKVFIHCGGAGSYQVNTSNPALSYDDRASEVTSNGTIGTLPAANIFEDTSSSRYIFKATETNTIWSFGIIRPMARGLTPTQEALNRMKVAGLSMEKTASVCENAAVDTNDIITYTVTLENTNSKALSGITITDTLPAGTEFVSGDVGVTVNGSSVIWRGGVSAKSTFKVSYSVKITADVPGTLITSNATYVSGVKLGSITHCVSGYSETQRALLGDTAIKYAEASKQFDSGLAMAKALYKDIFDVDVFEYTTVEEVLGQLIDTDNKTRHTSTPLSKLIAPNLYGGLDIRYGWLYLESENEKTRLPKEEHLAVGDIIVADWSGGSDVYVYAGNKTLVSVEDGVSKALTIGDDIYTAGSNIIISLLGYNRYAVLRPSMSSVVPEVDVKSIAVTTLPAKLVYQSGEEFDPDGMVVKATLTDGTVLEIDGYSVSPTFLTYPEEDVTVSFGDLTATVDVTVEYEELSTELVEDFDDAATGILSFDAAYNGWSAGGIMDTTKSPYMQIATDSANAENKVMNFYRDGSVNTDTDSKIMYLKYDLLDIMGADSAEEVEDAERYAKLKYSFRPNVQGNKFNVLLGELGTISLDMSKSCVRYNGASDTKLTYQNGSWYETELYVDLKEQKLSVFVNDTQYFKEAALSASQISYIQFYPDRYDAEKATGNLNYSYDLDDISFGAIDEDTYRNEVGVLGEGELLRESFNTVTTSAVRNTTTDAGWHKEYERDTTKSTITAGVDGDNNVASFKRMTSDYGYYHRLRYNLGETLTDGYYSLRFKLKSASATNKLFRVFFFDDDTSHTNECVELYFNNDTVKKFYRRVKDGAYDREALTKSFAGKAVTEWYNIEIIFNLTDAEIGKTSLYIDGALIFNDILADYKSSKTQNNGKLSGIAFGMGTTDATTLTDTDTTTVDAEYMLDDIVMKKLDTETTGVISADGKVTGISVDMGWIPAASQKFVAAVYEADEEGAPAALKGVSTAAASARGTSTLTLSKQLAYSEGDIIKVYYWDMGMLKPVGTLFSKTAQ